MSYDDNDMLIWWKNHPGQLPYLSSVARTYLSAPPTSVASKRLFSGAGILYQPRRRRLHGSMAEKLLFLKNNMWVLTTHE